MICPACKREIMDSVRFCNYCGARMAAPSAVPDEGVTAGNQDNSRTDSARPVSAPKGGWFQEASLDTAGDNFGIEENTPADSAGSFHVSETHNAGIADLETSFEAAQDTQGVTMDVDETVTLISGTTPEGAFDSRENEKNEIRIILRIGLIVLVLLIVLAVYLLMGRSYAERI